MSLADRHVLITGADGSVGGALVDACVGAGATLALSVRRSGDVTAMQQRLAERPPAMIVPCDLRYEEDVVRMVHRVVHKLGRVDAVINAAYDLGPRLAVVDYPTESWRNVMAVNVVGTFLVCREVLPWMIRQGGGVILNVTLDASRSARSRGGAYSVSVLAIEGLTRQLAEEAGESGVSACVVEVPAEVSAESGTAWAAAFVQLAENPPRELNGRCLRAADYAASLP